MTTERKTKGTLFDDIDKWAAEIVRLNEVAYQKWEAQDDEGVPGIFKEMARLGKLISSWSESTRRRYFKFKDK